jgi:hypothetical protein
MKEEQIIIIIISGLQQHNLHPYAPPHSPHLGHRIWPAAGAPLRPTPRDGAASLLMRPVWQQDLQTPDVKAVQPAEM